MLWGTVVPVFSHRANETTFYLLKKLTYGLEIIEIQTKELFITLLKVTRVRGHELKCNLRVLNQAGCFSTPEMSSNSRNQVTTMNAVSPLLLRPQAQLEPKKEDIFIPFSLRFNTSMDQEFTTF